MCQGGDEMHTLETSVVLPAFLFLIAVVICISLFYADMVSKHADEITTSFETQTINHADVVRGGVVIEDLYERYIE